MKKISLLLTMIFLTINTTALADEKGKGKNFDKRKSKVLDNINTKIGYFNSFKSCVSSAGNKDQLKSCRETHKSKMKAFKEKNKAEREARKAARNK